MAYFPDSLYPSRRKDEVHDVRGNPHVVSASDYNKHDEEIRAIQKVVGTRFPAFPATGFSGNGYVEAFSGFSCSPSCYPPAEFEASTTDAVAALRAILAKLSEIRNEQVELASGVVAVRDDYVTGVNGVIPFPSDWYTTLAQNVPDETTFDEQPIDVLDSVAVSDVSGLPEEGVVTIINGMDTVSSILPTVTHRPVVVSRRDAAAKVGVPFSHTIEAIGKEPLTFSIAPLAPWMSVSQSGNRCVLSGTPTANIAGTNSEGFGVTLLGGGYKCKDSAGAESSGSDVRIFLADEGTPKAYNSTIVGSVGYRLKYVAPIFGLPEFVAHGPLSTSLPLGLSRTVNVITGTPAQAATSEVTLDAFDGLGGEATSVLTISIGPGFYGETIVGVPVDSAGEAMEVTSVSPNFGPKDGGTTLIIGGSGFGSAVQGLVVSVDSVNATIVSVKDDQIIATTPAASRFGSVTLTVARGKVKVAIPRMFTYSTPPGQRPRVDAWTPKDGTIDGGDEVVFTGVGLSDVVEVLFGDELAIVVENTDEKITVLTPAHTSDIVTITLLFETEEEDVTLTLTDAFTFI